MIVAKEKKCAEGHELKPFNPLAVVSRKKASRMLAECNQCKKYRCKVEVIEKN